MPYKQPPKEHQFKPGQSGNPKGKPEGAISIIARLKKRFRENPEELEEFLDRYLKNTQNEKHIAEMIDGKPQQKTDVTSGGQPIQFSIAEEIARKNDLT